MYSRGGRVMPNSHWDAPLAQHGTDILYVFISQQIYMATYNNHQLSTHAYFLVHSRAVLKNAALSFFNCAAISGSNGSSALGLFTFS